MRRLLIGALVAILVGALWYFFVATPINERRTVAETDLEAAQNEEFTLRTTLARLQKIEENQLEYVTAIGQLESAIPPSPQLAELIDDLNFLADENGLAWSSGSYALPVLIDGTDIFEVRVAIQVDGQFFEILGYLYDIADLDRIVRVDAVSLSASEDEAGFHSMAATINAVVFTTSEVTISLDLLEDLEAALEEAVEEAVDEALEEATTESSTTTTTEGA